MASRPSKTLDNGMIENIILEELPVDNDFDTDLEADDEDEESNVFDDIFESEIEAQLLQDDNVDHLNEGLNPDSVGTDENKQPTPEVAPRDGQSTAPETTSTNESEPNRKWKKRDHTRSEPDYSYPQGTIRFSPVYFDTSLTARNCNLTLHACLQQKIHVSLVLDPSLVRDAFT